MPRVRKRLKTKECETCRLFLPVTLEYFEKIGKHFRRSCIDCLNPATNKNIGTQTEWGDCDETIEILPPMFDENNPFITYPFTVPESEIPWNNF
jgi:hypothetical protein